MNHAPDPTRARSYLLGTTTDGDNDALEQGYFNSPEAIEVIDAAEEALIEDYLSNRLSLDERRQFETHYLVAPHHRTRVETIRRLTAIGPAPGSTRAQVTTPRWGTWPVFALAAGLVLAVGVSVWMVQRSIPETPLPSPPVAPVPPPVAFEWTISPVMVRGASETTALVIPAGTDNLLLRFEGAAGNDRPIAQGRAVIRTVAGNVIWQGPVRTPPAPPPGSIAVVTVLAGVLLPEDYTITLFETGPNGRETERDRYFLRVRAR